MPPAVRSLVRIESGALDRYWNGYGRGLLVIEAGGEVDPPVHNLTGLLEHHQMVVKCSLLGSANK